jgi:hypothetical protein
MALRGLCAKYTVALSVIYERLTNLFRGFIFLALVGFTG